MTILWIVCGAGRHVGKTTLATRLCELLPGAVYAKKGCSRRKMEKQQNYFNTLEELRGFIKRQSRRCPHLVLECNVLALAAEGRAEGSVVVFVDGAPGRTDFRRDTEELKECAQLRICPTESVKEWRSTLLKRLSDQKLVDAIVAILLDQQRFLEQPPVEVNAKVWFEVAGERVFGAGLARLLEAVEARGVLTEAAAAVGMSYRYAWGMVRTAERRLGRGLVIRRPGGSGGGGSELTADGRRLLNAYQTARAKVKDCANAVEVANFERGERHEGK